MSHIYPNRLGRVVYIDSVVCDILWNNPPNPRWDDFEDEIYYRLACQEWAASLTHMPERFPVHRVQLISSFKALVNRPLKTRAEEQKESVAQLTLEL